MDNIDIAAVYTIIKFSEVNLLKDLKCLLHDKTVKTLGYIFEKKVS